MQGEAARPPTISSRARTWCSIRCSSASTTAAGVNVDQEMANLLTLAECLCRQCARHVGGARNARRSDEVVRTGMSISSDRRHSAMSMQSLVDMRSSSTICSASSAPGKKSDTYAGLGLDRGVTVGLRAQLSAIERLSTTPSTRSTCAHQSRANRARPHVGHQQHGQDGDDAGARMARQRRRRRTAQTTAQFSLDEMLGLLNTQAGDRYLFSGRATDQPAVETLDHILERRRRARRPQADHRRAQAGRSRRQRPRPADVIGADRDLGRGHGGRGVALRLQARLGVVDADRCDGHRSGRFAAGDVGRSRRGQSERRRQRHVRASTCPTAPRET